MRKKNCTRRNSNKKCIRKNASGFVFQDKLCHDRNIHSMSFFKRLFSRKSPEAPNPAPENIPKLEKKTVLKKNNQAQKNLEHREYRDVTGEHLAVRNDMRDKQGKLPYDPNRINDASNPVKEELSKKWSERAGVDEEDVRKKIGHTEGSYADSVKKFQKENDLDDDGIVGPKTLKKIDSTGGEEKPAPAPTKPEEKPAPAPTKPEEKPARKMGEPVQPLPPRVMGEESKSNEPRRMGESPEDFEKRTKKSDGTREMGHSKPPESPRVMGESPQTGNREM